jgi:hypothetical protein
VCEQGDGSVFRITTNGILANLVALEDYRFDESGSTFAVGLDGALYGTTGGTRWWVYHFRGAGVSVDISGTAGTALRVTTNGMLTTLLQFGLDADCAVPSGFVFGLDGALYGTTAGSYSLGGGNILRLSAWSFFATPAVTNGNCVIRMTGQPSVTYTVEAATAVTGPWQEQTNVTAPVSDQGHGIGVVELSDPIGAAPQRFYRAVYPPY